MLTKLDNYFLTLTDTATGILEEGEAGVLEFFTVPESGGEFERR